ncbi:porin [Leptothrix discophora]|uniref:Porin n=1 Tax=Leptothrix discophora TaxID=89 RepID=A0ABT9G648_LEPDI|nr:porin [Leptothrix discophora]MDP4301924.1 porin [Leptothrix discophora]
MKKSLIALAVLSAFAGVASAQSSVTLSGGLDAGLRRTANATSVGGAASSRNNITFSGTEDLGNGNNVFFTLNHRYNIQNGTQNGANNTSQDGNSGDPAAQFWRNTFVGFKNTNVGDVRVGRMLMPLQELNGGFEAWYGGDTVAAVHTDGRSANAATSGLRTNQGTYLRSANFGGVVLHAGYGRKEVSPTASPNTTQDDTVAPKGFGATFTFGPATLGAATDTNGNNKKSVGLYGKYNAGVAIVYAQFERSDTNATATGTNTDKDKRFSVSADVPVGAITFKVGYRQMDRADIAGTNKKVGAGLEYALSPRTKLYTNLSKVSGSDGEVANTSATTLSTAQTTTAVNGKKLSADVGIWHKF